MRRNSRIRIERNGVEVISVPWDNESEKLNPACFKSYWFCYDSRNIWIGFGRPGAPESKILCSYHDPAPLQGACLVVMTPRPRPLWTAFLPSSVPRYRCSPASRAVTLPQECAALVSAHGTATWPSGRSVFSRTAPLSLSQAHTPSTSSAPHLSWQHVPPPSSRCGLLAPPQALPLPLVAASNLSLPTPPFGRRFESLHSLPISRPSPRTTPAS